MSWAALSTAIYARAIADTGSGGLFASGDQRINAWYTNEAAANAALPYAVCTLVGSAENDAFDSARRGIETVWQVGVYHDKLASSAHVKHQAACERIVARFRRIGLTVTGYTASPSMYERSPFTAVEDDTIYTVLEFSTFLGS